MVVLSGQEDWNICSPVPLAVGVSSSSWGFCGKEGCIDGTGYSHHVSYGKTREPLCFQNLDKRLRACIWFGLKVSKWRNIIALVCSLLSGSWPLAVSWNVQRHFFPCWLGRGLIQRTSELTLHFFWKQKQTQTKIVLFIEAWYESHTFFYEIWVKCKRWRNLFFLLFSGSGELLFGLWLHDYFLAPHRSSNSVCWMKEWMSASQFSNS